MISIMQYRKLGDEVLAKCGFDKSKALKEVERLVISDTCKEKIKIYIKAK